jgi:hypothetical protein
MQQAIARRRITPVRGAQLVEILRTHPLTVSIQAVAGDPESTLYGEDIRRTLVAAGFTVNAALKNFTGPMHGIGLSTTPSDDRAFVASAFKAADVPFGDDVTPASEVTTIVGSKMPADPRLLSEVIPPSVPR